MAKPKLRFPEFANEWEEKKLKDISSLVKRINDNKEHPVMMLSAGSGFIEQSTKYSKDNAGSSLKKYTLLYKGELAYNRGNSKIKKYGCIFTLTEDSALVPYVYHCFKMKENNNSIFYGIYLNSGKIDKELRKIISSSARMDGLLNVSQENFMNIKVRKPLINEQQKIADFLSKVDKKIANQEAVILDYEEMKKGLMQKLFSQEVRFKADDGSKYPEWENKKWGSIGQFMKSGNLSKSDLTENGTPCILYGELYTKYKEIANTIYSKTNTPCEVVSKKGDVILPKSGETPEDISTATCIPYDGVALGGDLIIFRSACISGAYLSYLIANQKKWEIAKIAQGKTIAHISEKSLAKIDIEVPCYEEQQKIADCLSAMDRKIEAEKKILEDWKELKKALLQQMFV